MPVEGRGPELGAVRKGGRDLTTDGSLRGSAGSVRKLQNVLHAKAKEEPDRRFHALVDKVWRQDFLLEAWRMVRRNGGAAGVDGVTVADVEAYGVERWVGELSRDLRDGGYEPSPWSSPELCVKVRGSSSMLRLGCLGDLLGFEKREIEVAAFAPDRSSPQSNRGDKAERTGSVGEGAGAPDPTLDLGVQALEAVRGA